MKVVKITVTMRDKSKVKIKMNPERKTFEMVQAVRKKLDSAYGAEWQFADFFFEERGIPYSDSDITVLNDDKKKFVSVARSISQATVPIILITIRDGSNNVLLTSY